jgi:hypothetical protein
MEEKKKEIIESNNKNKDLNETLELDLSKKAFIKILIISGIILIFAFILIILLTDQCILDPLGGCNHCNLSASTAISFAVKSANPSGEFNTGCFILIKDDSLEVKDLALETDLDKESFIFTMGEFTKADGIETDGNYLKSVNSKNQTKISAIVVCKPTNANLVEYISSRYSNYDTSLAENGCANDGIACCVIIPTKATS